MRKIYTKIVFDKDFNIVEEEFYWHKGKVAECSGSGGGAQVTSTTPEYMRDAHSDLLRGTYSDKSYSGGRVITYDLVNEMNRAMTEWMYNRQTNGDFATDTNWTKGSDWYWDFGEMKNDSLDYPLTSKNFYQEYPDVDYPPGAYVRVNIVITHLYKANVHVRVGGNTIGVVDAEDGAGGYTFWGYSGAGNKKILIAAYKLLGSADPGEVHVDSITLGYRKAGTNPYTQRDAYDPTADLADVKTKYDTYEGLIQALDNEGDWSSVVSKALLKIDDGPLYEEEDISTAVEGIITKAISEAVNASKDVHENLDGKIKQAMMELYDAYTRGKAELVMSNMDTKADTFSSGVIDAAVDNYSYIKDLIDEATSGSKISAEGLVDADVDKAKDKAVDILSKAYDEMINDSTNVAAAARLIGASGAGNILQSAKTLANVDASDLLTTARARAIADAATLLSAVKTIMNADASDIIAAVKGSNINDTALIVQASAIWGKNNLNTVMASAVSKASADILSIMSSAISAVTSDATNVVSSAVVSALSVVDSVPIQNIIDAYEARQVKPLARSMNRFAGGMFDINAVVGSAFAIGTAMLESDHLDKVREFDAEINLRVFEKALPLYVEVFTTELSELMRGYITEVSTYMNLAIKHAEDYMNTFLAGFEERRAEYDETRRITLGEHDLIGDRYIGAVGKKTDQYVDVHRKEADGYLNTVSDNLTRFMQTFAQILPQYIETYLRTIPNYLQAFQTDVSNRSALASDALRVGVGHDRDLINIAMDALKEGTSDQMGAFNNIFQGYLRAKIATDSQVRQQKEDFINQGVSSMVQMLGRNVALNQTLVTTLAEANRMKIVAESEYTEKSIDIDADEALWNLKLFQYGANLLSSVSGGGVVVPERMSKTSSALTGAMSGAVQGGELGTLVGQPAIGAAVGGIGGLIAGWNV